LVIGATGSLGDQLVERARTVRNLTVLRNISSHDAQCLRATSEIGVFPTRVIPGFIETFCVAALEYEALGVPVLASAIGGVPEATPDDRFLVAPGTAAIEWLARIDEVLANRAERKYQNQPRCSPNVTVLDPRPQPIYGGMAATAGPAGAACRVGQRGPWHPLS
jgi:glycosyltransferase involved in cell wall biosynthesis